MAPLEIPPPPDELALPVVVDDAADEEEEEDDDDDDAGEAVAEDVGSEDEVCVEEVDEDDADEVLVKKVEVVVLLSPVLELGNDEVEVDTKDDDEDMAVDVEDGVELVEETTLLDASAAEARIAEASATVLTS